MRPDLYKRPNKPAFVAVKERRAERRAADAEADALKAAHKRGDRAPLAVHKSTECHVTPPDVAARMVAYFGGGGDYLTLEPSAGTGNLISALFAAGQTQFELCAIEREASLWLALKQRFPSKIRGFNECFLGYAARAAGRIEYPRIIMNPPFSKARQHIEAARSLWGFGGHRSKVLIALVPATFEHPEAEELERLGPETFASAAVHSKIIRFHADA